MKLSIRENEIILDCFNAILSGKFLWESELHTRIGLDRVEIECAVSHWPNLDEYNLVDALAVSGCLRDSLNDIDEKDWREWIKASQDEVEQLLKKWNALVDWEELMKGKKV